MKKWLCVLLCVLLCLLLCLPLVGCHAEEPELDMTQFVAAQFDYAGDDGYKYVTSEIASLHSFFSLLIVPSDEAFVEPWVYRIVFNPKAIAPNGTEYVVLFGEKNLSVNGVTYVPAEGVDYADILDWAAGKYEYFDYELYSDK